MKDMQPQNKKVFFFIKHYYCYPLVQEHIGVSVMLQFWNVHECTQKFILIHRKILVMFSLYIGVSLTTLIYIKIKINILFYLSQDQPQELINLSHNSQLTSPGTLK
jgi:hypothetical protein